MMKGIDLEFLDNLTELSETQHQEAFQAAQYIIHGTVGYYLLFGGALGISHMTGYILKESWSESSRIKLTLISGIIFFSALIKTLYHEHLTSFEPYDSLSYTESTSALRLITAGFLIGFGSQLAIRDSSCEFGFCGLPFFNYKSILSHVIFILVGCLTQTFKLYKYLPSTPRILEIELPQNISYNAYLLVFLLVPFLCFVVSKTKSFKTLITYISLFMIGIMYGYGMMLGGYAQRKQMYQYLTLDQNWDPKLIVIFSYGLLVHAITYLVMRYAVKKPLFGYSLKEDKFGIKASLLVGSVIYGVGWGLGGLSLASILILTPLESIKIIFYWGIPCILGMKMAQQIFRDRALDEVKK